MMRTLFAIIFLFASFFNDLTAQTNIPADSIRSKMQWFADAKLGIFIHWGVYAVKGIGESWSFHNKQISHADYMNQLKGFTAAKYDPAAWAALIKESGARYAVITTKHHDGVALWATKQKHYNIPQQSPAHRDVLTPFFTALDKEGIKKGAYFSLIDWSYPDYPGFLKDSSRYKISNDPARWQRFLNFYQAQINELNTQFHPDLWWFDGDWEHSAEEWQAAKVRRQILQETPRAVINGRLQGYGDYETPEQNFPVTRPAYNWWELCMTINNSWGYQPRDTAWKTPYEIITIFADVISNGGNLLLDIGPTAEGIIPAQEIQLLKELGKWNKKHQEAVFGTLGGLPQGHFYGPTTLSKDSSIIYLFAPAKARGPLVLKGLSSKIKRVRLVGSNEEIKYKEVGKISWSPVPGLIYIPLPPAANDDYMDVIAVELESPVKLYRGHGGLQ
jgi:alpha-L-fucosidase